MGLGGIGVGGFGAFRQGMLDEEKRVDETRLKRMKSLQEMADAAAANGQEFTFDQLYEMAGANGINLFGDAPTSQMIEALRVSQNAKAQEAARKQTYDQAIRVDDLTNRVRTKLEDLVRSGVTDPIELHGSVSAYGPDASELAKKMLPSVVQGVQSKDFADGVRLGGAFQTLTQAQEFIKANGLKGTQADGILQQATANQQRLFSDLASRADRIGANMEPGTSPDQFERSVKAALLPGEENLPGVTEFLRERAMTASRLRQSGDQIGLRNEQGKSLAGYTAQFIGLGTKLDAEAEEAGKKAAQVAYGQSIKAHSEFQNALATEAAALKTKKKLTPELESYYSIAGQLDLRPEEREELKTLAASGEKEKYQAKVKAVMQTARPAEEAALVRAQFAYFAAGGDLPSGITARQAFETVANFDKAYDDKLLTGRGAEYREWKQRGQMDKARSALDQATTDSARAVVGVRDILTRSGRVSAAPEEIEAMEQQHIMRLASSLAASSGEPVDAIARMIYAKRPPPQQGMTRQVRESERLSGQANPLYQKFGLVGLGGAGGGGSAPAPATTPQPFAAPPAQPGSIDVQGLLARVSAMPPGPERTAMLADLTRMENRGDFSVSMGPAPAPASPSAPAVAPAAAPQAAPGPSRNPQERQVAFAKLRALQERLGALRASMPAESVAVRTGLGAFSRAPNPEHARWVAANGAAMQQLAAEEAQLKAILGMR